MVLKSRRRIDAPYGCPISAGMGLLGGIWTPSVIWCLSGGARRFSELRRNMPTISAKVLSGRLRELEGRGILRRDVKPTSPPTVEYELTPLGEELLPAIRAIADVGFRLTPLGAGRTANGAGSPEDGEPARVGTTGSVSPG